MAGLLDFVNSPAGIGLLSAVAGGLAGARRGTPINNVGRGLVTGLSGYANAQDLIRRDQENALTKQYRELQMKELQRKIDEQNAQKAWKAGLSGVMKPKLTGTDEQGRMLADQTAEFGQEGVQPLVEAAQYTKSDAPLGVNYGVDQQAVQEYLMQPDSPYADKLIEQKLIPKAPKWTVVERYNERTGMPEKVLMDENNPSDIRPFGGAQADTIVADNLGGSLVYRGSRSATPLGQLQRTVSPDSQLSASTARRGQDISNANAAASRAVAIRGQDKTASAATTGKPPTEAEAKAAFYAGNMRAASAVLDNLEKHGFDPTSKKGQIGTYLAGGLTNPLAGKTAQQARQAQNQWAEQMLRMQTGAAATKDEIERTVRTYFPAIGDSAAVVAQKRQQRKQAEQGVFAASGRAAGRVQQPASGGIKFLGFE